MRRHSYYSKLNQTAGLQAIKFLELAGGISTPVGGTVVGPGGSRTAAPNSAARLAEARRVLGPSASQQDIVAYARMLTGTGSPVTSENVGARAVEALELISDTGSGVSSKRGTLEHAVYEILAGTRSAVGDDIFEEEARRQANIIRSILFFEGLTPEQQAMRAEAEAVGAATSATAPPDNAGLRRLIEAAEMGDAPSRRTEYSRLTRERVARLFENKLFRRGAIGAAALTLASFGYSKIRDVNHEKLSGPPLLPGGNPYESNSNNQALPQASFDPRSMGVSAGMSYKVNINGSNEDIQKFNTRAGGLVNGNSNTTIYNSLPRMNRDPYVEMGRNY